MNRRQFLAAAAVAAACLLLAEAQPARAYGPLVHTLTAFKSRNESADALGKRWAIRTDRSVLAVIMAGTLVHDIGYTNPRFRLFSDLAHYQDTGAFVDRFLGQAVAGGKRDAVAFGLGLALHHAGDRQGHDGATNRIVARLAANRALALDRIAYEDGTDDHACVERWIDGIAIADRKFLPESELAEYLLVLDGLAGLVEQGESRDSALFGLLLAPLSSAIELTYGLAVTALVNSGSTDAAYLGLPSAYRRSLRGAEIAIGIAEELYGLKVDYSKLRYWHKVPEGILEHFFKECGTLRGDVEKLAKDTGWVADSIGKSTALYARYLAGIQKNPGSRGAARTAWAQGKAPPAVNLDTNLTSARGEYRLADLALDALEKQGGKVAAAADYRRIGAQRAAGYFATAGAARIGQQVLALDRMEREANNVTAPGRASPAPLQGKLPRFHIGAAEGDCGSAPAIHLARDTTIRVASSRVCLPRGATVLAAWIGALAAAERASPPAGSKPKDWAAAYRDTCYAYFPRDAKSKLDDVIECHRPR